ncbi:hypothetical protein NPIL_991 [Nephila pilipes]|uniref:Uncharacterized protein n=1 Tax=Nephila pilipes TaxID=299642 RepID=A0A8X6TMN4_NEPPI|nr:hypothetical protein NPIL_991 [Nephila pilipes]
MNGVTRSGIYCEHFSHCLSLGTAKSAFHGEVEEIKVAPTLLYTRPSLSDQAVIFSDSQADILAISTFSQPPSFIFIMQCRSLLGKMREKL